MRRLLDANDTDSELLEDFRTEVFTDRVFVVTPKGKIIDLPWGRHSRWLCLLRAY